MNRLSRFHRIMLSTSALSWLLVTLMPVLNAHSGRQNIWETFCHVAGLEIAAAHMPGDQAHPKLTKVHAQHGKPCPCAHFSNFHYASLTTTQSNAKRAAFSADLYTFGLAMVRFELSIPRAPPFGKTA